jgi:hypothetical protein
MLGLLLLYRWVNEKKLFVGTGRLEIKFITEHGMEKNKRRV